MVNKNGRKALQGGEASVLDLIAEVLTSQQWAELLKAPLERAAFLGNRGLAQKLVGAGAEVGDTLHGAVRGGHQDIVIDLLENGASVATRGTYGRTPLHRAAEEGETGMVKVLLLKGADKDALDNREWTPLHLAVEFDHTSTALALLAAGADVSLRCLMSNKSVVHMAALRGQVDILKAAIEHGADVNDVVDTGNNTPLHRAAFTNKSEAIDVLVEAGASIAAQEINAGSTPLHMAFQLSLGALLTLLRHDTDVDARDLCQETPLHYAAANTGSQGAAEVVDSLLRSGADETIVGESGIAANVVGLYVREEHRQAEDVECVRKLLANAATDRAWRRRGYLVLCRAHPNRVRQRQDSSGTHAGISPRSPSGADMVRTQSNGCNGTVVRNAAVHDRTGGGSWAGVVAKVLELKEEGLFRTIVGYV